MSSEDWCICVFFFLQNILIDLLLTRSLLYPHNKISLSGCFQTAIFFLRRYYSPARFSCLPEWLRGRAAQRGEVNCLEDAVPHAGFGAPSVLQLGQGQVTPSSDMEHDASRWCGSPCAQRRASPRAGWALPLQGTRCYGKLLSGLPTCAGRNAAAHARMRRKCKLVGQLRAGTQLLDQWPSFFWPSCVELWAPGWLQSKHPREILLFNIHV